MEEFMTAAIEELNKCTSYPKVGAVIVKNGIILSRAYRNEVDRKHAERIAIEKVDSNELRGSMIFTTLEPCIELNADQPESSCVDIIIENEISKVIIGVLDPNGQIYCQGYSTLLNNDIEVDFFTPELSEIVEGSTFIYGDCGIGYGPGNRRRVAVIGVGKNFEIQFSETDERSIRFRWQLLQFAHGFVDLASATGNHSIREATHIRNFNQIANPLIFRETSHLARMRVNQIVIIYPPESTFLVLIKLTEMTLTDIWFQWEVRNV